MSLTITIDNYEEIMFRLVEDDFDELTRNNLLQQIEKDELFKFEWEAWQKARFNDPLETYSDESIALTDRIIVIAEPQVAGRKRFFYYWAAAASLILLIASLFFLTTDFTTRPKPEIVVQVIESKTSVKNVIPPAQNQAAPLTLSVQKKFQHPKNEIQVTPVVAYSNRFIPTENALAEIPNVIDSVLVETNELAIAPEKKPRYTITIETSDIVANNQNNNDLAQNPKVQIKKVFTNTKMLLCRKPNGEPDRIILIGDENSYLCINLNY